MASQMIDLSHVIHPGKAGRKFAVEMVGADTVNQKVVRLDGQWYIMHNVSMVNHIATHIEAPYHIIQSGADLSALRLDQLVGEAVLLDLRACPRKTAITEDHVREAAARAGGIRPGDIVFCNLGGAPFFGTEDYALTPYFSPAAIQWLVAQGMKLMGVDASGVEVPRSEQHVNHHALFEKGIPLIENLTNLDRLSTSRFMVYALPVAIAGLDAFPLRVIAVES
ncbi:MAG: cyclase family protein [Rhodoplanes sp.]|uniref:cyclase family protein n=1 Tax=Rhodoplanes sp. TaxID=1968906 RepID=UPI00180A9859|nr:cyclase family protein [Rhodoplanes sp.]NVO12626.1 cyclase family protein [Rhodoplanes sp.]